MLVVYTGYINRLYMLVYMMGTCAGYDAAYLEGVLALAQKLVEALSQPDRVLVRLAHHLLRPRTGHGMLAAGAGGGRSP